jgi:hypothetical protein
MKVTNKLFKTLTATLVALAAVIPAVPVHAASATLSLSPSSSSVSKGATLTVSVRENSGADAVHAVQANLTYPADLLSFLSISSSSAFPIDAQSSGGGGSVQIARGSTGVTGLQTVATVRFKALTNSGKATISFAGGSSVASNGTDITAGTSGGTYTLTDPPVAAPAAPEPPKDTTPPKITDVKVTEIGVNSAVLTWTTSEPATSEVHYGATKSYGWAEIDGNLVTAHKLPLNTAFLSPGHSYHYTVKSVDPAGNATSTNDAEFSTEGAKAIITVTNTKKKPVKGAKVSILEHTATTDKNGHVTISGLMPGKQTLVVSYSGGTLTKTITVADPDAKNTPQPFTFVVNPHTNWLPIIIVILIIGAAVWLWRRGGGKMPPRWEHAFHHKVKPVVTATPPPSTVIKPEK